MSCLTEPNSIAVVVCAATSALSATTSPMVAWWQAHSADVWRVVQVCGGFALLVPLILLWETVMRLCGGERHDK
jgi:hypothetical protein